MTSKSILDEFVPQDEFAAENDVSPHTIARYRSEADGLPFAIFGGKIYIHLQGAREWMARRVQRRAPLRRPGTDAARRSQ